MPYETISSVTGLFFIIYSFKHVKDQINTLNINYYIKESSVENTSPKRYGGGKVRGAQ